MGTHFLHNNLIVFITVYPEEETLMKSLTTTVLITALAVSSIGVLTPAYADQHGKRMMHYSSSWKASLTEDQANNIAQLKLDHKKKVYPLKAKIKQAKIELALLITENSPSQSNINKKIDQIIKLKAEKMRLKANHKIKVRKILNDEQRVKYDIKILKKANQGKKRDHRGYHR